MDDVDVGLGVEFETRNTCCNHLLNFLSMIIIFFIFFSVYKTRELPSIHVEEFYVPALNSTGNITTINNTIYINLKLKNRNPVTGLYYIDPLYFNLSYIPKEQNTSVHLVEFGLHGFYQGNGKAKTVKGLFMTRGLPSVSNGTNDGTQGAFRVSFVGKVRYKLVGYHQRQHLSLAANVEVDDKTGVKAGDKAIRLVKSGAWGDKPAMFLPVSMLFGVIFI